jgi:hypothetical protein
MRLTGTTGFIQAGSKTGASAGPATAGSATANWPAVKNQNRPATVETAASASSIHAWRERRRARR